jgi:hypothetical protein
MRIFLLFSINVFVFMLGYQYSNAQTGLFPTGARAIGMGNAAVTLDDHWSVFNNPAGMTNVKNITAGFAYENRFNVQGLRTVYSVIVLPTQKKSTVGIGAARIGDNLYNEQVLSLAYAHKIEAVSLGFRANYLQYMIETVGSKGIFYYDFGAQVKMTSTMFLAGRVSNMFRQRLVAFLDERLPTLITLGVSYRPNTKLMVNLEGEKDVDYKPLFRAGVEYSPLKNVFARGGVTTNPTKSYFGAGFHFKQFMIDYALNTHPQLGLSHQFALSIKLKERKVAVPPSTTE